MIIGNWLIEVKLGARQVKAISKEKKHERRRRIKAEETGVTRPLINIIIIIINEPFRGVVIIAKSGLPQ